MSDVNSSIRIYVYYEGPANSRFDRDFYDNKHLPLVMKSWAKYGLESVRAFYPSNGTNGTLAICECVFRDEAAARASFSSDETPEVMADVPRFTDLAPKRTRALPMDD